MLGIEARPLPCDPNAGFVPDPDEAGRLIDARTRAIVLVTPNNPTGAIYPEHVIGAFADLCRRRGLWLVLDETYRDFLPPSHGRAHGLFADGAWREHVIGLYSFSKAYCIPGYRLGAVDRGCGGDRRAREDPRLHPDLPAARRPARARLGHRRAVGDGATRTGARCIAAPRPSAARSGRARNGGSTSIGAYFAYVRHPFAGETAAAVAEKLAVERGVLALPGSYFGAGQDTHLRMAFGNIDVAGIEELGERLRGFAL